MERIKGVFRMDWWKNSRTTIGGLLTTVGVLLIVLWAAIAALNGITVAKGQVVVDTQFLAVLLVVAAFGVVGGLAYDITEPLHPGKSWRSADFDNRTALPSLKKGIQEWGFVGPMVVGAVAALTVVFLLGVDPLPQDDATNPLARAIPLDRLVFLPLIAGFAGSLAMRVLRGRLEAALKITELTEVTAQAKTALEKVVVPQDTVDAAKETVQEVKDVVVDNIPNMATIESRLDELARTDPKVADPAMVAVAKTEIIQAFEGLEPAIRKLDDSIIKLEDLPTEEEAQAEAREALERIDSVLAPAAD
jgi:hypothetical protein